MSIFSWLVKALQYNAYRKLIAATRQPGAAQQRLLKKIIRDNKNTRYGLKYKFQSIRSLADFQANLPIVSADEYQQLIKHELDGNYNAICNQPPHFIALTAGSTGSYKHIPITKDLKKNLDQAVMAFNYLVESECPELKAGKIQFIVGSANGGQSEGGIPQGFISGYNYKHLPKIIRSRFLIPYPVFEIENAQDRYYAMARFLVGELDLRAICAISPVNIIRILESVFDNLEQLIEDLNNNTLSLKNSPNIEQVLKGSKVSNAERKKNSDLARKLLEEKARSADKQIIAALLFPQLKYCLCWMGGNMHYYIPELKSYFPNIDIFEMPFSASEGIFALPYQKNKTGGIPAVNSAFLEFIAEQDIEAKKPKTHLIHELQVGQFYYLVITTAGGLYRYNMEDLVLVKEYFNKIPALEFISKKSRQISIANERLNENQVTEAMLACCQELQIDRPNFILFPCKDMRYRLVVDNEDLDLEQLSSSLDRWLKSFSKGYEFERDDQLLLRLVAIHCDSSEFSLGMQRFRAQSNLPNAQIKPIHLSNEFDGHKKFLRPQKQQASLTE